MSLSEGHRADLRDRIRVTLPVAAVPPAPRRAVKERWNLLFLGRLERSKGAHLIVRAAAQAAAQSARPVRLAIAGRGTLAGDIAAEAAAYPAAGVPLQVDVCGWLAEGARAAALQQADLLLMPSLWPEPFGLSGLEAGSAGVPAVAFAAGGIPEWLADGVNGRLVSPGGDAVGGMAAAIADVLGDPCALAAMRVRAIEAASRFTLERHLGELQPVFAEAAVAGARARSTA
jgi:glycosyltransferase involved in cell wall biosynthesis